MGKKAKSRVKGAHLRVACLCSELLRLCDADPAVLGTMDCFRNLYEVTTKIRDLQKGDREARFEALRKRYKECFHSHLSICEYGETGFGVRADESIEKNKSLLHVPLKYALSVSNVSAPLLSLPNTYSTVAYFSDTDFAILDGFPAADAALKTYRNICRQYAYFYLLFERAKPVDSLPAYMKPFCFEDYQWAISTVMSRNNALPIKGDGGERVLCLIPLWDMVNHKQCQITTEYDPTSERIVFYAMESYQQGDEIFMDYGKRTSTEFLLYNGFVPETNPFHNVPINLGLSKFDKLMQLRAKVLGELGLRSEICPVVSSQDGAFPSSQLAAFARVFVMKEAELQVALDEMTSESPDPHVSARLVSGTFLHTRVDEEAKKFIEGRIKLLIRNYEFRLEKSLQTELPAARNGLTQRPLFGGALQILLPSPVQDVSTFRQVPDNQEVFVNPSNNQSITIDILEAVSPSALPEAVNVHFQEIVNCNSASDSVVDSIEVQHISNGPPAVLLRGKQKVSKFNRLQSDLVGIAIMLYRFTDYSADVLVCFNDPIVCQDQSEVPPSGRWSDEQVNTCLHSLELLDPNIFVS
ncbi:unnamed protein product [Hydatigera taeniaeformis]|uniref:protein-histidine N-methyltransferase n=1 Tax=Hydatigena taeniaeformis TaxID=6205 RepID=A0A0R3X4M8_HYDTA|nr:unnamed protein product [Hydatigera taeniaeformis]